MPWMTVAEAAATLHTSDDTVRRRIRRGTLRSRQTTDGRLEIEIEPQPAAMSSAADSTPAAEPAQQSAQHQSADAQQMRELTAVAEHLRERLADAERTLAAMQEQSATAATRETTLLERLAAADQERAELRQLLAREQQAHAEARVILQALIPKLPAPTEEQPRRRWWRWW